MLSALTWFVRALLAPVWGWLVRILSNRSVLLVLGGIAIAVLVYVGVDWQKNIRTLRRQVVALTLTNDTLRRDTASYRSEIRVADSVGTQIIIRRDTIIRRIETIVRVASPSSLVDSIRSVVGPGVTLVDVDRRPGQTDSTARIDYTVDALRRTTSLLLLARQDKADMAAMIDAYSKRAAGWQQIGNIINMYRPKTLLTWPWTYHNRWNELSQAYWSVYVPIAPAPATRSTVAQ